ncbi:hypothetical protein [Adhaeribacter aquaticus]|uniref:hypothetical protein n=1 Tax=Adhaeribacter aquaticus TaxID=299567 RepID=UPI00041A5241|nr:hypothetical protein [Adhaeribacter aquaticus]
MLKLSEQILEEWGREAVAMIQENIRSMPVTWFGAMNASGKTAESVRFEVSTEGLKVYALKHIFVVETGRKAGKFPPISVIRQWIDDKPIIPKGKISKNSLAFLIARSIAKKGTVLHQMGGKSGILTNVINQERLSKLKNQLLFELNTVFRSTLLEATA